MAPLNVSISSVGSKRRIIPFGWWEEVSFHVCNINYRLGIIITFSRKDVNISGKSAEIRKSISRLYRNLVGGNQRAPEIAA